MIFEGSRYEHSDIVRLLSSTGTPRQTVVAEALVEPTSLSFAYYTVKSGDRIDLLADRFLGDSELWWVIADANPQHQYYDFLPDGIVLRIPSDRAS